VVEIEVEEKIVLTCLVKKMLFKLRLYIYIYIYILMIFNLNIVDLTNVITS
jgi:hypothetical protein